MQSLEQKLEIVELVGTTLEYIVVGRIPLSPYIAYKLQEALGRSQGGSYGLAKASLSAVWDTNIGAGQWPLLCPGHTSVAGLRDLLEDLKQSPLQEHIMRA